jgi:hypothetical protein
MSVTAERGWSMDLLRIGWPGESIRSASDLRLQQRGEKKKNGKWMDGRIRRLQTRILPD